MAKNNPSKRQKSDSSARSVFVYTGGARRSVPKDVVRVKFDPSVVEVLLTARLRTAARD